jgi:hypothetical protein
MWDMEREAAVEGVSPLSFQTHIVQRLDDMMRPSQDGKLSNCGQVVEIKVRLGAV